MWTTNLNRETVSSIFCRIASGASPGLRKNRAELKEWSFMICPSLSTSGEEKMKIAGRSIRPIGQPNHCMRFSVSIQDKHMITCSVREYILHMAMSSP
jgi:hypothetical protein